MRDRETGRSRGFGFVTLSTSQEADDVVTNMNESELDGRRIKCNIAIDRHSGGGGGGRGRGLFILIPYFDYIMIMSRWWWT